MLDKIVIGVAVGVGVLCVLGIITIPEYIYLMGGAIVGVVLSYVFLTIIGGFIAVLWGNG